MLGRDAELTRLVETLERGALLVTLTGTAGVGKTTLAGHLVRALRDRSAAAVYFADLTHAVTQADVESAVLRALSRDAAWREHAQLGAVLESLGPTVLVLDNFEQLVALAEGTIAAWIASVPELQIVVTSRERLHLSFEVVQELRPLALPAEDACEGAAVELWTERVRAIDASYRVDASSSEVVAELVRRLDGLPLAIELAAARLGRLPAEDLRAELAALSLAPGLRDAIDASWELLDEEERCVFAACGVFRGDISVEAIQAVAGVASALDAITSLLDKSLLVGGGARAVTMLETSRVYACEALARRADRDAIEGRHRDWFRAAAARARVVAERDPRRAQRLLDQDRSNLQAVVRRGDGARTAADLEAALVVATALDEPRWQDGSLTIHEGTAADLGPLLVHPLFDEVAADVRVRALVARARVATWRVDGREMARADLERAVEIAETTTDASVRCLARRFRALAALVRGAADAARADADAALELAVQSENPWLVCLAEAMIAFVLRFQGETRRSRDLLERSRAGLRGLGNDVFAISLGIDLVYVNLDLGDVDAAWTIIHRVEREREALGMPSLPRLQIARGHLALERGNAAAARGYYADASARAHELGESVLELVATVCTAVCGLELSFSRGAARATDRSDELDLRDAIARMTRSGPHLYAGLGDAIASVFHALLGDARTAADALARAERASTDGFGRMAYELCRAFVEAHEPGLSASSTVAGSAGEIVASMAPSASLAEIRILTSILARVGALATRQRPARSRSSGVTEGASFLLDREGRWFVTPEGERVACGSRPVMRRILVALVEARLSEARSLPADAIAEAGWPGERMLPAARKNRLHVMLTRIRDLGLRAAIEARDDGYRLSALVRVDGVGGAPPALLDEPTFDAPLRLASTG